MSMVFHQGFRCVRFYCQNWDTPTPQGPTWKSPKVYSTTDSDSTDTHVTVCFCTLCLCCYTLYGALSVFFRVWTSFSLLRMFSASDTLSLQIPHTKLSTLGSRASSVFAARLHGMTFPFFSDRNPFCTTSDQTSRHFLFQNNRPAMLLFFRSTLVSSSASSLF